MTDHLAASARHIVHVMRPAAGGMRRHLELLCAGLSARGYRLSLVAPPDRYEEKPGRPAARSPLGHLDPSPRHLPAPIGARPHPFRDLRAARIAAGAARGADLLHGHGLRGAWIAALAARTARRPFVFTAHNLAPSRSGALSRLFLRWTVRRAVAVVAVSRAVADSLAPLGADPARVAVIPNGIDLAPFDRPLDRPMLRALLNVEARETPDALYHIVAAVGRLEPEKGFDVLAEAAHLILGGDPCLIVLVGDGAQRERLMKTAESHWDRFIMTYTLSEVGARRFALGMRGPSHYMVSAYSDVPGLFAAADVVVVPSRAEGQGLVALEAMAARKPVVASRVGGLVETVRDGETGLLVPPGDPAALQEAVIELLRDEPARRRMGEAGRALVEREYTADRMVERTAALYARVLAAL